MKESWKYKLPVELNSPSVVKNILISVITLTLILVVKIEPFTLLLMCAIVFMLFYFFTLFDLTMMLHADRKILEFKERIQASLQSESEI